MEVWPPHPEFLLHQRNFPHEPWAVTMTLWEPKRKCPKAAVPIQRNFLSGPMTSHTSQEPWPWNCESPKRKCPNSAVPNTTQLPLGTTSHTSQEPWPWNCESPKESVQRPPSQHNATSSWGHFQHAPRAVTMTLWEPKRKPPKAAVPTHLQNHVVWSRTL